MYKNFKVYVNFIFFIIIIFFIASNTIFSAEINLIPNSSVETTTTASVPDNWLQDNWGTKNAQFIYKDEGYQSDKSLYVKVSKWQDGDAKWYFEPVAVQPNTDYVYSDFYKSNVRTSIVAMSLDAEGNPTYFDVSTKVQRSGLVGWRQATYTFRTLPDTKSITIFHLIGRNGWLQIDNANLSLKSGVVIKDFVPNNSVEIVSAIDSNLPNHWLQSSWGTNTPIYEYSNDGHDGTRSVKLTITEYVDGDAKWDYTPQALAAGNDYKFSAWYKTDTNPHVVARYLMNDGTEAFYGMSEPIADGTGWQYYSDVFPVPTGVKGVSVFFFLMNNGTVQVDDYHVVPYNYVGFNQPIVTITFDDGFESNANTVLPILEKYGFKVTYCYATKYLEEQPDQIPNFLKITNAGHEACAHSVNHTDLTLETIEIIDNELSQSKSYIENLTGQIVTDFTSPFSAYNSTVIQEIKKYFTGHRTTDEGYNSKDNLDPYKLKVQNMQINTTLAEFQKWVNKAKADKTWLILVYHFVDEGKDLTQFDTKKADFESQMQWLKTSGVKVMRMDNALAEVQK